MNICFIAPPPQLSGGMRIIYHYAEAMANNHSVSVLFCEPQLTKWQKLKHIIKRLLRRNTDTVLMPSIDARIKIFYLHAPLLADIKQLPEADIYIATWWETMHWLTQSSLPCTKMLYFIQGYIENEDIPLDALEASYRHPAHKLVVSDWLAKKIAGYSQAPISTIENAYKKTAFYTSKRTKQHIPSVGFLFSPAPVKNIDTLVRVLKLVKQQRPELIIRSFGKTRPTSKPLRELLDQFDANPSTETIRKLYQSCDIWLSLSHREGFNLTALEAMACGTPCISSDTGWPSSSIKSHYNGVLVTATHTRQITDAIDFILDQSEPAWQLMSQRAQASAQQLDWSLSEQRFETLLQQLYQNQNTKPRHT